MKTFAEEMEDLFHEWNGDSFYLLLDYSKASTFDARTSQALDDLKEKALEAGAVKVFSVPQEDSELSDHISARMQAVLEGKEEFLMNATQAKFAPLTAATIALAA
ncbi:MAG TPA: hypothetical protein VHE55_19490 [Fimbriimonadaceae bacterium]|nr:hypothetical protein [Fimbriimonadaceae bacterium]